MGLTRREAAALDRYLLNPPELEEEDREPGADCARPGRHGCGACPGCSDWGDREYDRKRDQELEDRG
jgi:hypothetical protein